MPRVLVLGRRLDASLDDAAFPALLSALLRALWLACAAALLLAAAPPCAATAGVPAFALALSILGLAVDAALAAAASAGSIARDGARRRLVPPLAALRALLCGPDLALAVLGLVGGGGGGGGGGSSGGGVCAGGVALAVLGALNALTLGLAALVAAALALSAWHSPLARGLEVEPLALDPLLAASARVWQRWCSSLSWACPGVRGADPAFAVVSAVCASESAELEALDLSLSDLLTPRRRRVCSRFCGATRASRRRRSAGRSTC